METSSLNKDQNQIRKTNEGAVIDARMKYYRNDPFIVKKAARAREIIAKYGLPKGWNNKE